MPFDIRPGESYVIRRKVLKVFGAAFHVYDPRGQVVGYCRQKAFKLKEDLRIYTDESCTTELVVIKARSIIDFGATYDVTLADGSSLGTLRRKGMTSTFLRDTWLVFDPANRQVATLREDGGLASFMRRWVDWVSVFWPEQFTLARVDGTGIARYRRHFNLFVYRLSVSVLMDDPQVDDLVILAAGCLIAAIEGRQQGG